MKQVLSIEQSAELIKRGVSADKASKRVTRQVADSRGREIDKLRLKRWKDCVPYEKATMTNLHVGLMRFEHKEIFTLADLLSLLPKSIEYGGYAEAKLNIYSRPHRRECWVAKYIVSAKTIPYDGAGEELIDALYEVLCKLLDNHVKLD